MSGPVIGSLGVAVVPDAENFWRRFREQTEGKAEAEGRRAGEAFGRGIASTRPDIRIGADTSAAERRLAELRAQIAAATAGANVRVGADTTKAQSQMHLLRDAILLLGPATIPIAAVLTGALAGAVPVAATLALGISGIVKELKTGALAGTTFGADINTLKDEFRTLQATASAGLLSGLHDAMSSLQPLFAVVNADVGQMSLQLGQIVAHVAPALVSIFNALNPLFVTFGNLLVSGAAHLQSWAASSTGISSFVRYVQAQLPLVISTLGNLITTISHLLQGAAGFGGTMLIGINAFSAAINAIPVNVLKVLVPLALSVYAAFRGYAAITAIVAGVSLAVNAMKAPFVNSALAAEASSLAIQAAAADEAASVALSKADEAAAIAASTAEIAAAVAGTGSVLEAGAVAAADAAAIESAAFAEAAATAVASSAEIAAAATAAADASVAAGRTASIGFSAMLGPVGAVIIGVGLLAATLLHSGGSAKTASQSLNDYTESVKRSTDALNQANVASTVDALSKKDAFTQLDKVTAGNRDVTLSYNDLTLAVNGSDAQYNKAVDTLSRVVTTDGKAWREAKKLTETLKDQRSGLSGAIDRQKALDQATSDATRKLEGQSTSAAALYGLHGTKGVDAYLKAKQAAEKKTLADQAQTLAMQQEGDAAGLLKQAFDVLNGKTLDVNDANVNFRASLLGVTKSLHDNGKTLDLNTEKGIANNQAISQAIHQAQTHAEAISHGTKLTKDGTDAYKSDLIALRDHVRAVGGDTTEIQKLIDTIGKQPAVKKTKIEIEKEVAARKVAEINGQIAALHGKQVPITADVGQALNALIDVQNHVNALAGAGLHVTPKNVQHEGSVLDFYANGGINNRVKSYADGAHVAQIAPAGAMRVWAEPETGGEGYIPLAASKRARSESIMSEIAARFGGQYVKRFDNGGVNASSAPGLPPVYVQNPFTGEYLLAKVSDVADAHVSAGMRQFDNHLTYG